DRDTQDEIGPAVAAACGRLVDRSDVASKGAGDPCCLSSAIVKRVDVLDPHGQPGLVVLVATLGRGRERGTERRRRRCPEGGRNHSRLLRRGDTSAPYSRAVLGR